MPDILPPKEIVQEQEIGAKEETSRPHIESSDILKVINSLKDRKFKEIPISETHWQKRCTLHQSSQLTDQMVGDKWGVDRIAPDSDISNGNVNGKKGYIMGTRYQGNYQRK